MPESASHISSPLPAQHRPPFANPAAPESDRHAQSAGPATAPPHPLSVLQQAQDGSLWTQWDPYLSDIDKSIDKAPSQRRQELRDKLENCRKMLSALRQKADGLLSRDNRLGQLSESEIAAGSLGVVLAYREAEQELKSLHDLVAAEAGKRNWAKTIALAVVAAVVTAAALTAAVLLAPVMAPAAAMLGTVSLAMAAAGFAIGGVGLALGVALTIREMLARPSAYRHLPSRSPELAKQFRDMDASLVNWVLSKPEWIDRLTIDQLDSACGSREAANTFLAALAQSDLPPQLKVFVNLARPHPDPRPSLPLANEDYADNVQMGAALPALDRLSMANAQPGSEAASADDLDAAAIRTNAAYLCHLADCYGEDFVKAYAEQWNLPSAQPFSPADIGSIEAMAREYNGKGDAKRLQSAAVVRIWPEVNKGLRTRNYGHAAMTIRESGKEPTYHSWWPSGDYRTPLSRLRGTAEGTYAADKDNMLPDATIEKLRAGELIPRGRQKVARNRAGTTWEVGASKVYLPLYGNNALRTTDAHAPVQRISCMFGLSAADMRERWDGTIKKDFRLLSRDRNCAGATLRLMTAGGATLFAPPPNIHLYAAPSTVLKYAGRVAARVDALNARVDRLLEIYRSSDSGRTDISLKQAWQQYTAGGGKDLLRIFNEADIESNDALHLMRKAMELLALPKLEERPQALAVLCGLKNRLCDLGPEVKAIAAAPGGIEAPQPQSRPAPNGSEVQPGAESMPSAGSDGGSGSTSLSVSAEYQSIYLHADADEQELDLGDQTSLVALRDPHISANEHARAQWAGAAGWARESIEGAEKILEIHGEIKDMTSMDREARSKHFRKLDDARTALEVVDAGFQRSDAFIGIRGLNKLMYALENERRGKSELVISYVHQLEEDDSYVPLSDLTDEVERQSAMDALHRHREEVAMLMRKLKQACRETYNVGFRGRDFPQ